ncbi:MAG TPA: DNA recombination protein RmuC [Candidatus Omnitrophota bacterium]|nr:DNA recombination protein RmuC [Candidatus Omnitrophota bacterium]
MDNVLWIGIASFVIAGVLFTVFFAIFNLMKRQIAHEVRSSQEQFLQLAKQQFATDQSKATGELETKKQAITSSIDQLKEELEKYKKMVHDFERDRQQKYGNLEYELKNANKTTLNLQETTNKLNNILGNVKLRGQWGERMAEDIIRYAGLIEGVNYRKQTKLSTTTTKPDYTFLLPDEHIINMDVKFPLDNYLNMVNIGDVSLKERYLKDFERNVKDRIKEIQGRDYINPQENTLDFVLLFIPNEQVFGFIQDQMPGLMDEALKQKVVLCSPFTLYAMLCIIRQAYEHFRFEKDIKKIIQLIDQFSRYYEGFKTRFEKLGESIGKLEETYEDVKTKSFKNLDAKIRHIEDYKKGKKLSPVESDDILIDLSPEPVDDDAVV